jgi:hypothetical protein
MHINAEEISILFIDKTLLIMIEIITIEVRKKIPKKLFLIIFIKHLSL